MEQIISRFGEQFKAGSKSAGNIRVDKKYRRIISCGMGGSAVAGEILSMVQDDIVIHWDYDLPKNAGRDDLVICTSWSGSTEETISSYLKAVELGLDHLVITKGGKLGELAKKNNSPTITLPDENIPPRFAAGYMISALFTAMGRTIDISVSEGLEKEGRELADKIQDKMPLIYSSYPWRKITGFWKMMFNENCKIHCFANWLPSGAHNELAGFDNKNRELFIPVIIHDTQDDPRHDRNQNALLAIFDEMRYNYATVKLSGDTLLEKVSNSYVLALWTSFFVAKNLGIDPRAIELIEKFKKIKASI